MSAENHGQLEGAWGSLLDDTALTVVAAHELSSPLSLVRQLSIAVGADGISDEERQLLGKQLTLTSERALRMTASLSMSALDQTRFALEPINPLTVCQNVVHELSPLFVAHGQTISLQQRIRVPLMVANRKILQQILLGLCDNALYYGSADQPIRMMITATGNKVRIGVRDYGPAIPTDIWQKLEERIGRRSQTTLASRPHSSGVGLVAARRLAEMMDSAVGVIRHRDGATFYVDIHVSGQMSLL